MKDFFNNCWAEIVNFILSIFLLFVCAHNLVALGFSPVCICGGAGAFLVINAVFLIKYIVAYVKRRKKNDKNN